MKRSCDSVCSSVGPGSERVPANATVPIASVQADYPGLLISAGTADQLDLTGRPHDQRVAKLIRSLVSSDDSLAETTHRVLLLSEPGDPATLLLPQPVKNTKKHKSGRALAWTVGSSVVSLSSLAKNPATTDELDAFEIDAAGQTADSGGSG